MKVLIDGVLLQATIDLLEAHDALSCGSQRVHEGIFGVAASTEETNIFDSPSNSDALRETKKECYQTTA